MWLLFFERLAGIQMLGRGCVRGKSNPYDYTFSDKGRSGKSGPPAEPAPPQQQAPAPQQWQSQPPPPPQAQGQWQQQSHAQWRGTV